MFKSSNRFHVIFSKHDTMSMFVAFKINAMSDSQLNTQLSENIKFVIHNSVNNFCSIADPADFPYIIYYATFPAGTPPGQQQCVNISTVNDTDVENNEIFTVNLVANSSKVAIGDRAGGTTATITITDNDGEKLLNIPVLCCLCF